MPVEFGPIASQFRERSMQASAKTSEHLLSDETFNAPSECARATVGRFRFLIYILALLVLANVGWGQWPRYPDSFPLDLFGDNPKIVSDLQGGVWVITVGLHHVNGVGFRQWNPDQPRQAYQGRFQSRPQMIVRDETGGVYVVSDIVSDERDFENEPNHHIHVQHFNSDGEVMWGQEGIRVWRERSDQRPEQAITDDEGGMIITYSYADTTDSSNGFYNQRITSEGELLWPGRGHKMDFYPNSNLGFNDEPCFTDGHGGAYVVGQTNSDRRILKLTSDGEEAWEAHVMPDSGGQLRWGPCSDDGNGGLIYTRQQVLQDVVQSKLIRFNIDGDIIWERALFSGDTLITGLTRNGDHLYAALDAAGEPKIMCFNLEGEMIWDSFVQVGGGGTFSAVNDGLCFTWQAHLGEIMRMFLADKLSLDGRQLWGGVTLANGYYELVRATDDGNGGIIVVGTYGGYSYCYLVNRNGEMGIPWTYVPPFIDPVSGQRASVSIYPNPSHGSIQIAIDYPGHITGQQPPYFSVYDFNGRLVQSGNLSAFQSGILSISQFPTGQYFIRVQVSGNSNTQNFIIQH